MFEDFDNKQKRYEITYPNNTTIKVTTQELYEFYIFQVDDFDGDFSDLKFKLDSGHTITVSHNEFDFGLGAPVYKGKLSITRFHVPSPVHSTNATQAACDHKNKYIVQHFNGGVKYWVCPVCKADLGDA